MVLQSIRGVVVNITPETNSTKCELSKTIHDRMLAMDVSRQGVTTRQGHTAQTAELRLPGSQNLMGTGRNNVLPECPECTIHRSKSAEMLACLHKQTSILSDKRDGDGTSKINAWDSLADLLARFREHLTPWSRTIPDSVDQLEDRTGRAADKLQQKARLRNATGIGRRRQA